MTLEGLPSVGEVLVNKYRLTRELGRGGMGAVYEAEHLRLGQKVAVKVVLPEVAQRPDLAHRFEHEARAAARLRGRHTVRVLDADSTPEGLRYLVMELLEGRSLRDELERRGPLPIAEAVRYVREACEGVSEMHRAGIVHRDLKPANLFLSVEERGPVVKVVDFGIAKAYGNADAKDETATNVPLGTCKYMSPEQVRSARSVDMRTDIWSLGVVLYELLAGKAPFLGEGAFGIMYAVVTQPPTPLCVARPDVPEALTAVIERALCKDVTGRYQTARELSEELAPFEGAGLSPPPPSSGRPAYITLPAPAPHALWPKPLLAPAHEVLRGARRSDFDTQTTMQPVQVFGKGALDESVTSRSKSRVGSILSLASGRLARSPWLVYGALTAFSSSGIALGFQAARSHSSSASLASVLQAGMASGAEAQALTLLPPRAEASSRVQPTEAFIVPPPPAIATASEPSRPKLSPSAAEDAPARPPKAPEADDRPVRAPLPKGAPGVAGGSVEKAPALSPSTPLTPPVGKPHEGSTHQDKPDSEATPAPATSASPKPQVPTAPSDTDPPDTPTPDRDRFEHLL